MQKEAKTRNFTFIALETFQGRRQKCPKPKYTKTNKDKDKISPILPERDLPRPLSNAGSCSTNYSTAPTSPLKKEAVIFNTLSIGDVHTSLQNSICCLLLAGLCITKNICIYHKNYSDIQVLFSFLLLLSFTKYN